MDKHEITWDDDAQGLRPPTSIEFCFDFNDSEGLGVSTSELSCSGHWRTSPDHRLWWIGASNDHGFYMFLGWELYWVLLNPMTQANMVSTGEPITQSVTHRESDRIADAADALRSQGFVKSTQVTQESKDVSSSLRWGIHAFCWMIFKAVP